MNRLLELRKNNPSLNLDENIKKCADEIKTNGSSKEAKEAAEVVNQQLQKEQQERADKEKAEKAKPAGPELVGPPRPVTTVEKPEPAKEPEAEKTEKTEKPEPPKAPEKELTAFQKEIAKTGAYTLDTLSAAYNDAAKNGKGVAMVVIGENTSSSKEMLANLPELQRANPNLNFVVVNKDQVNASSDPAMGSWKKWVDQSARDCNGKPFDHAFTCVQSMKADAQGIGSPAGVSSTHWGADIAAGLKDQAHYAAEATARNIGKPTTVPELQPEVRPVQPEARTVQPEVRQPQGGPHPTPIEDPQVKQARGETPKVEAAKVEPPKAEVRDAPPVVQRPKDAPAHAPFISSEAELQQIIAANNAKGLRTIVDFTRTDGGCGPCNGQAPVMDQLASRYPGQVYKVDATNPMTATYANRFPTIVGFGNRGFGGRYQAGQHSDQEMSSYLGSK